MRLGKLNKLLLLMIIIVAGSAAMDVGRIIMYRLDKKRLEHYIIFERENIELKCQEEISQIKTCIAFKKPDKRNKLQFLTDFDLHTVNELEKQILALHPDISTLDSLPYGNKDLQTIRMDRNRSEIQEVKSFYENLLRLGMLKQLVTDVCGDSECQFYVPVYTLLRPISSDSVYMGTVFYPDGRSKYAYQINGRYFEGLYESRYYSIPKADTLDIYTIMMENTGLRIDTQYNHQLIRFDGKRWREEQP